METFFRNSGVDFLGGFGENLEVASAYFAAFSEFLAMNWSNL